MPKPRPVADSDGTWLRHEPIPLALAREAIAFLEGEGYSPNVYVGDELYVAEVTAGARVRRLTTPRPARRRRPARLARAPPTKLVCVGEPEALDAVELRAKTRFGERMYISKSLAYFLEFAAPGVTKGAGLDFLAERLDFTPARDDRLR